MYIPQKCLQRLIEELRKEKGIKQEDLVCWLSCVIDYHYCDCFY